MDPDFLEEEFIMARYHNIEFLWDMEITRYVEFLKKARINYFKDKEYSRWLISGASNQMSLEDFRLKLMGKETTTEKRKRLASLDI